MPESRSWPALFSSLLFDKGALFRRHDGTIKSTSDIYPGDLGQAGGTLRIQEEIVDERKRIEETEAGRELLRELDGQVEKRLEQLRELQEMLNQTEADDNETRQELQQEVLRLREELATLSRISGRHMSGRLRQIAKDVLFYGGLGAGIFLWVRTRPESYDSVFVV